jgi:hypothetical protein
MTLLTWTLITAAASAFGAIAIAGIYAEAHRAPDQP